MERIARTETFHDDREKIVAITGASSGIGRATALMLAAARRGGGRRRPPGRPFVLAALADEIAAAGGRAAYRATDVTRREDLRSLVELACDRFGRLDVIVNNAGSRPVSRFDALGGQDWEAMIDVNVKGVLYGIAAALPVFRRQQSGHVVNVISTAGLKIVPTMGVYAATKNAVRTITETLRQESGPHIRVTEVSPGMIATDFADVDDQNVAVKSGDADAVGRHRHRARGDRARHRLRDRAAGRRGCRQHRRTSHCPGLKPE